MMKFLLVCSVIFPLALEAQQATFLEPLHFFENDKLVRNGLFTPEVLSFDQIQQDFSENKFRTYSEFLDYLFLRTPELKDRYVLVHHSESQQLSSLEHPRILLFRGATVYGLSDEPSQKSRRVEILETSKKDYSISLSEIEFTKDAVVFRKNPQSCTVCHGSPAKPLWNPYDFWPSAYGSAVGSLFTNSEKLAYEKLRQKTTSSEVLKRIFLPEAFSFETEDLTAFTQTIHQINLGRWITQNLPLEKLSKSQAYPLMAILLHCTNPVNGGETSEDRLASYLSVESTLSEFPTPGDWRLEVTSARKNFKNFLDGVFSGAFSDSEKIFDLDHNRLIAEVPITANFQWYMGRIGIDTSNLATSLHWNDYLISSPSDFSIDFFTSLYVLRPDLFEGIQVQIVNLGTDQTSWVTASCDNIKAKAVASPATLTAQPLFSYLRPNVKQPVLSRCTKCHVESEANRHLGIPAIPFHKTMAFAKLLASPKLNFRNKIMDRVRSHGREQMPPGQPLSLEEINALEEYLSNLAP